MFGTPSNVRRGAVRSVRPALEALEARCVPAIFTVDSLADSGTGSLRQALASSNAAAGADEIVFAGAALSGIISLSSGELPITDALTITGPGSGNLTITGNDASRIFNIVLPSVMTVSIAGLTLTHGRVSTGNGGAIYFHDGFKSGSLNLTDVSLTNNQAVDGGGAIYNFGNGAVTLRNSTLSSNTTTAATSNGGAIRSNAPNGSVTVIASIASGNHSNGSGGAFALDLSGVLGIYGSTLFDNSASATGTGGAIFLNLGTAQIGNSTLTGNQAAYGGAVNAYGAQVYLVNSTVAGNTATISGGGIRKDTLGTFVFMNSIISANTAPTSANVGGTVDASVNNLIDSTTVNLLPLANNGGPVPTMALGPGSSALNAGVINAKVSSAATASATTISTSVAAFGVLLPNQYYRIGTEIIWLDAASKATRGQQGTTAGPLAANWEYNLAYDQRGPGYRRKAGAAIDIGAYEEQAPSLIPEPGFSQTLVSVNAAGQQQNGFSALPAVSGDGRYVVFNSTSSNLVPGYSSTGSLIFRKDLVTGAVVVVSLNPSNVKENQTSSNPFITDDGRFVVFSSSSTNWGVTDSNGVSDIYRKDMATGDVVRASASATDAQANAASFSPAATGDGRYVFFTSSASNLVADDTNGFDDVFRKDLATGEVLRISLGAGGVQGNGDSTTPSIASDGRYVFFRSSATNLVAGDTNGVPDLFRVDMQTGTILRVNTSAAGAQADATTFGRAEVSPDGRYAAFYSMASNLVAGDANGKYDVFVKDLLTGAVAVATSSSAGVLGNANSFAPRISASGRYVTFYSSATNLVPDDSNALDDVFRKDLWTGELLRVSTNSSGGQGNSNNRDPSFVGENSIVYTGGSNELVPSDLNANTDSVRWLEIPQRLNVLANTTVVYDYNATEADPNQTLTYSLGVAPDAAWFSINAATGVLSFTAPPSVGAANDFDHDNVYELVVQVSDGLLTDWRRVLVSVVAVLPPTIASVTPAIGPTAGGTLVIITGAYLSASPSVFFGGIAASSVSVNSATQITAIAPPHTGGFVDVLVTTTGGSASLAGVNDFTYTRPTIAAVEVNGGPNAVIGAGSVSLAGQHSVVKQIKVTFDQPVTVAGDAFTVVPRTSAVVHGGAVPSTLAVSASAAMLSATECLVTLSGPGTHDGGIIASGVYDLTAIGAKISNGGDSMAGNLTRTFFALFGTIDANNTYTAGMPGDGASHAFVDPGSLFQFSDAFGSNATAAGPPTYNVVFDSNLDGAIDPGDLFAFSDAFGVDWSF